LSEALLIYHTCNF